jgi:rhomboid protease GluP
MNPRLRPSPPPVGFRAPIPMAKPLWTYVFMAVDVVVFLVMTLAGGTQDPATLDRFGANTAWLIATQQQYWRLFTANFIHIGIVHLAFNMFALFQLGRQIEALYGRPRFLTIYLLSGLSGAIFSYMLTQGRSAGASTALFGLFGALVVYFYRHREMFGRFGQQQLINLGIILLINVIIGLSPGSNIDNWGHFGGFIGGLILSWFLCPSYVPVDPFERAFEVVVPRRRRPELSNGIVMDANSLIRQAFPVAAFAVGLVALTFIATALQRPFAP